MVREVIDDHTSSIIYFEVPNVQYIFRDLAIWTIIYEHCSYFSRGALARLFSSCGFTVRKVYECYKGQFLGIEAVPNKQHLCSVDDQYNDIDAVAQAINSFLDKYRRKIEKWRSRLDKIKKRGARTILWGAGARAVSFLNSLNITDQIPYVVDINPRKFGKYLPGTAQQIVPSAFLRNYRPNVVIVMNDIYKDEIEHNIEDLGLKVQYLYA